MNEQMHWDIEDDIEAIEGYCVRCKETVEIEDPQPVWTRRGMPATRGTCPDCGGTVFRMGKTDAHEMQNRPEAVQVAGNNRARLAQDTAYIVFAEQDAALAEQIADDLQKIGIASWLHENSDNTNWAGGVHPALKECNRMVVLLSPHSAAHEQVMAAWQFFKEKGKRIAIAQLAPISPPDAIRRSPRFDFTGDYKTAFRQMVAALSE
ncbi:MAG: toll/interleukin-1 receptor domain-containing protein [Anaerolineaceae bacterium]|nr:toll/interleukin-1 receptor domain-containing protein [Anaerolineaceae bacterium]